MQSFVKRNFQVPIGIVIVQHVYVHRSMWIVEMENANITNIVGMENVIMVRQLKRAQKNATNAVVMVYVVPWRIVRIVHLIVENVKYQPPVEIIFVKWEKHANHVRVIVDVIQTAAMVHVRIQLVKIVKHVQGIVERVHQIQFVEMVHVMGMKHVVLVQGIVGPVQSFVETVYVMGMNYAVRVQGIVEHVHQILIVVMEPVMQMKNAIHVRKIVGRVQIFVATVIVIHTKHVTRVQPIVGSALQEHPHTQVLKVVHRQVRVQGRKLLLQR